MATKKGLIIAVLATFCLTSTLFMIRPIGSNPGIGEYDPWVDLNDDGTIDIFDAITLAGAFETSGTPINKTGLLLELQSKIDSLNASLNELMYQVKNIYEVEIKAYCLIENKSLNVDIAKNGVPTNFTTTHRFPLIGNNTFTVPVLGPNNHTFTHWNTGSNDTTITVSSEGEYIACYMPELSPPNWYNGLVGYWKLDEGTGMTAGDSSGNNNNGTITGNPSWVEGKYLGGLSLDGDDYIYVGSSSSIVIHQCVSVECWVKVFGSTGDHQVLLTQNTESIPHYTLEFQPDGRTIQFAVHQPGQNVYAASEVQIDFGRWAHIVGTYNGTHACIYVNGICTGYLYCPGILDVVDFPVWIGSHTPACTWDRNWFNGTIDSGMLYSRTLSAEEILAHYLLPPP